MSKVAAYRYLQKYGGYFYPVFLLLSLTLFVRFPFTHSETDKIDENSLGSMQPPRCRRPFPLIANFTAPADRIVVRGELSPGSEVIAVYVATRERQSVAIANGVIAQISFANRLPFDTEFFFIGDEGSDVPMPTRYMRAALVLNVSAPQDKTMCIDAFSQDGLQPNQDLVNVVKRLTSQVSIRTDLWCARKPYGSLSSPLRPLALFFASMEASIRTSVERRNWHALGARGVDTIGLSTRPLPPERAQTEGDAPELHSWVCLVEGTLVSLGGLEERLHHSMWAWTNVSDRSYVPFDVTQFCVLLNVSAVIALGYSIYKVRGFQLSLIALLLPTLHLRASVAASAVGFCPTVVSGVVAAGDILLLAVRRRDNGLIITWLSVNCAVLCVLLQMQGPVATVGGLAAALQVAPLHQIVYRSRVALFVGAAVAWALYGYCPLVLDIHLGDVSGISQNFANSLLFPNAVLVTGMLVRSVVRAKPAPPTHHASS